ncbi:hypothetical protein OF83DRAFT_1090819 [Amylostereum chailletii]|nr:hypothetical protein OF83DRAFT_1090819 [Amylostereum chailletii]
MLVLSSLHKLLSQALGPHHLTAALLTPSGQLVACAHSQCRTKDNVRVVVGLAGEVWAEVHGVAAVESEVGRIVVAPVEDGASSAQAGEQPLMLVVLCATEEVEWDDLEARARELAKHLSKPVNKIRGPLTAPVVKPPTTSPRAR